jgi:4-hydroxybenzoate polyprenyltransferase
MGAAGRWLQALRIIHPFPTVMNVAATGGLALIATRGGASLASVAHLMLAMLAVQACIGTVNDLTDRELDAASKPSKPLVQGALSVNAARRLSAATFVTAVFLSAGFGVGSWLLSMAGLGCGLAYDLI